MLSFLHDVRMSKLFVRRTVHHSLPDGLQYTSQHTNRTGSFLDFVSLLNGGRSALHPRTVRGSFPNPTQKRCVSGAQSAFVRRMVRGTVPDGPQYIFGQSHRTKLFLEPVSNFTGGPFGPQGRTVRGTIALPVQSAFLFCCICMFYFV